MVDAAARRATPVALALLLGVGVAVSRQPLAVALTAAVLSVLVAAAYAGREGWALLPGLLLVSVGITVVASGSAANLAWFGTCVVAGWASLRAGLRPTLVVTGLLVLGFAGQALAYRYEGGWWTWVAGLVFTVVVGLMAHRQGELITQLRAAQAGLAERAATEERARIARELHDVIGHALTVSLLHVTSARLALREDPDEAAAALEEAERLGQQSLAEVRHAVGLLREQAVTAPLPGAGQLDDLVEGFRRTGTPLAWEAVGDPTSLSATSGLTLYRILQEALTNAARHAPGVRTSARLVVAQPTTELVVDSHATARAAPPGAGVTGMRERAESVGGTLTAGPEEDVWRVRAVLPT